MNRIELIGRLTKKPELRRTKNDKFVATFTLAVSKDKETTNFINCVVWGIQAENLEKYQDKGSLIGIVGELNVRQYEDNNGNKKTIYEVLCNEIEFLSFKEEKPKEESLSKLNFSTKFDTGEQIKIEDSDLPF